MDYRKILSTFIKEVIEENDGIYNWSWCPHSDDYEHELEVKTNPDLWRENILREHWMVNNPAWNVYEIGMRYVNGDGEVKFLEDATVLVEKKKSVKEFVKDYKNKGKTARYIEWIDVLGDDGGHYENIDDAVGPFECLDKEEREIAELCNDQKDCFVDGNHDELPLAYYQELADSILI